MATITRGLVTRLNTVLHDGILCHKATPSTCVRTYVRPRYRYVVTRMPSCRSEFPNKIFRSPAVSASFRDFFYASSACSVQMWRLRFIRFVALALLFGAGLPADSNPRDKRQGEFWTLNKQIVVKEPTRGWARSALRQDFKFYSRQPPGEM